MIDDFMLICQKISFFVFFSNRKISHYRRKYSKRLYVTNQWTIKKLHEEWLDKRVANREPNSDLHPVSYNEFRMLFRKNFPEVMLKKSIIIIIQLLKR